MGACWGGADSGSGSAAGAVSRLHDLGVEYFLLASALKGVMAQRLVRRVCSSCKEEDVSALSRFEKYGLNLKKSFKGKGCKPCNYTGYSGRAGIFELALINEETRDLIYKEAPEAEIVEAFRRQGVKSILEDGVEKIEAGVTTPEEVLRVTQED